MLLHWVKLGSDYAGYSISLGPNSDKGKDRNCRLQKVYGALSYKSDIYVETKIDSSI